MNEVKNKLMAALEKISWPDKLVIVAAVFAIISPFFNWFHACTRMPGVYTCKTWNGFEWDNDIYGLVVFLSGLAILYSQYIMLTGKHLPKSLSSSRVQLLSGILLVVVAIVRTLSFRGESTSSTSIGPSMGLLFVFASGIATVLASQIATIEKIISSPHAFTQKSPPAPSVPEERVQHDLQTVENDQAPPDELDILLQETSDADLNRQIEQQKFDL